MNRSWRRNAGSARVWIQITLFPDDFFCHLICPMTKNRIFFIIVMFVTHSRSIMKSPCLPGWQASTASHCFPKLSFPRNSSRRYLSSAVSWLLQPDLVCFTSKTAKPSTSYPPSSCPWFSLHSKPCSDFEVTPFRMTIGYWLLPLARCPLTVDRWLLTIDYWLLTVDRWLLPPKRVSIRIIRGK